LGKINKVIKTHFKKAADASMRQVKIVLHFSYSGRRESQGSGERPAGEEQKRTRLLYLYH